MNRLLGSGSVRMRCLEAARISATLTLGIRAWSFRPLHLPGARSGTTIRVPVSTAGNRGRWMRRREFISLLGGAVLAPLAAHAQQRDVPVIAFLSSRSPEEAAGHTAAFLQGLKAFGYVDGQTARIEYRWARGQYERLPALASELTALRPAVIVAGGGVPSARAAKAASPSVPVIFLGGDPVSAGLVASLNRPGGNATGVSLMSGVLGRKRLELLAQLVPKADVVALLTNPQDVGDAESHTQDVQAAARTLGRRLIVVGASAEPELERSFTALVAGGATAVVVQNDPFFDTRRDQLIALAARHKIAAIYHIRELPAAGGLMSYGPSLADAYHQVGIQAGRILKGANVADLPVVQPTHFELVLNLNTAKALDLPVPPTLLAQADEVIE
jgi:putative tryptophan/tyrosine transport system substrate-binding protein